MRLSTSRSPAGAKKKNTARAQSLAAAALLLAYFLYFSRDVLQTRFEADDMMNLGRYWRLPAWRLAIYQLTPWQGYFRPMGGVFYKPIFHWFGLNPAPYHAVILVILGVNEVLIYRLARLLGCSGLTAALAALPVCYHAGLSNLQYAIDVVYDILCFSFFLGALLYCLHIRMQDRLLRFRECVCFLALYLCALNSKEMAVTLPAILLVWEWLYASRGPWSWRRIAPIAMAAGLNVMYIYGRAYGHDPLLTHSGYIPVLSAQRFLDFQAEALGDLFYLWGRVDWRGIACVWTALVLLAWRSRNPATRFCVLWIALTPLPIEFLPVRSKAALYIPLAGWAILAAIVLVQAGEFVARIPGVRWLRREVAVGIVTATAVAAWTYETNRLKEAFIKPVMQETGRQTFDVIQQLDALHPRAAPNSQIVFLTDPFAEYDMEFIAELWFHDPTITVWLQRKDPQTPEQLARADHIFTFEGNRLVQLR